MMRILDFLFPPRTDELLIRECSPETFLSIVSPRIVPATRPATVSLLPYHDNRVRAAIHEAKYHGNSRATSLLGTALAEYLFDTDEKLARPVLVPMPLGTQRLKDRGFNQVEEIARAALRRTASDTRFDIEVHLIRRSRETPSQVSLPHQKREQNMRGAFTYSLTLPDTERGCAPDQTIVLLDDVLTTGATMQAAIDALTAARAIHILPIALAH